MAITYIDKSFREELRNLINRHSIEKVSNTSDFVLAEYLIDCLKAFDRAVSERDRLSGKSILR